MDSLARLVHAQTGWAEGPVVARNNRPCTRNALRLTSWRAAWGLARLRQREIALKGASVSSASPQAGLDRAAEDSRDCVSAKRTRTEARFRGPRPGGPPRRRPKGVSRVRRDAL
jgi:hypothetical protein